MKAEFYGGQILFVLPLALKVVTITAEASIGTLLMNGRQHSTALLNQHLRRLGGLPATSKYRRDTTDDYSFKMGGGA